MSSILQRLRLQGRTRKNSKHRKKFLNRFVSKTGQLKHQNPGRKQRTRRIYSILRDLKRKKRSDNKQVGEFMHWCGCVGLELHPNVYIGEEGSCHKIGVVAMEDISEGECLAVIPRNVLLSCSNSVVSTLVDEDEELQRVTSNWVTLLIALAAEYSLKASSHWHPYLSLVPNNKDCGPPMMWLDSDRERLLEGTGLNKLVDQDLAKMEHDFTKSVLPFMQRHPQVFRSEFHNFQMYKKLVSLVMSYSFTDAGDDDQLTSSTMMVPFVDLLNHHSHHHAELNFHGKCLKLMAIRDIQQGEEIMNTYGQLSNATLLHTYGFCEVGNPHNTALVTLESIYEQYFDDEDTPLSFKRQERWEQIKSDDLLEGDYCIDCNGDPEQDLLCLVKLLHIEETQYENFLAEIVQEESEEMYLDVFDKRELCFLGKLVEHCLSLFPENYDSLIGLTDTHLSKTKMCEKEKHALNLSIGQQHCLIALHRRVAGSLEP